MFIKVWKSLITTLVAVSCTVECKIYPKCELARELQETFNFPKQDISKWLCLVHWESSFNTAALNKGAIPNSFDHGIFQINDYNWCQDSFRPSENRCQIVCERLRDDDLSDDVECLKVIMRQRGFDEWMSHPLRCSKDPGKYFDDCVLSKRDLKLGIGLTSEPKGLKVNLSAKPGTLRLRSKLFSAHLKLKPFFSSHHYITP